MTGNAPYNISTLWAGHRKSSSSDCNRRLLRDEEQRICISCFKYCQPLERSQPGLAFTTFIHKCRLVANTNRRGDPCIQCVWGCGESIDQNTRPNRPPTYPRCRSLENNKIDCFPVYRETPARCKSRLMSDHAGFSGGQLRVVV
jgi:hypothetical protein